MRIFRSLLNVVALCGLLLLPEVGAAQRPKPASETPVPGDAAKGAALFQGKGECISCHRAAGQGSRLGSNLTEIANKRTVEELQKALVDPPAQVQPQNRQYRVVTRDGKTVTGRLLNQSQYTLQMLDTKERLLAFQKSDVREAAFIATPSMPSYRERLSSDELQDLMAYLVSLKGVARQ